MDSKTGEQYAPDKASDGEIELVHGIFEDVEEAKPLLDLAEQEYGAERARSLNVYKDGKKILDGTEYFTEQVGFEQF